MVLINATTRSMGPVSFMIVICRSEVATINVIGSEATTPARLISKVFESGV